MIHHMCGGFGAWLGAVVFDRSGNYGTVFLIMCVASLVAALLTIVLDWVGPADRSTEQPAG